VETPARLADDAVVIRGGLMLRADVERNVEVTHEEHGYYGMSVWSGPGDADQIAQVVGSDDLPWSKLRQTTVGRLAAVGFALVPSEPRPLHFDIDLEGPLTDEKFAALEEAFDRPQPNPVAKTRR
jgi:hypothetical protein